MTLTTGFLVGGIVVVLAWHNVLSSEFHRQGVWSLGLERGLSLSQGVAIQLVILMWLLHAVVYLLAPPAAGKYLLRRTWVLSFVTGVGAQLSLVLVAGYHSELFGVMLGIAPVGIDWLLRQWLRLERSAALAETHDTPVTPTKDPSSFGR